MNIFVLALLVYLVYRFVAGFLIPLFRTTRHVRQHFQDMTGGSPGPSEKAGPAGPTSPSGNHEPSGPSKVGEYIDFEEIK
jgi:hypothetical protein